MLGIYELIQFRHAKYGDIQVYRFFPHLCKNAVTLCKGYNPEQHEVAGSNLKGSSQASFTVKSSSSSVNKAHR